MVGKGILIIVTTGDIIKSVHPPKLKSNELNIMTFIIEKNNICIFQPVNFLHSQDESTRHHHYRRESVAVGGKQVGTRVRGRICHFSIMDTMAILIFWSERVGE